MDSEVDKSLGFQSGTVIYTNTANTGIFACFIAQTSSPMTEAVRFVSKRDFRSSSDAVKFDIRYPERPKLQLGTDFTPSCSKFLDPLFRGTFVARRLGDPAG